MANRTWSGLSLLLLAVLLLAPMGRAADTAGLLGDWRFDEGTGDVVADRSGHGHDGEVRGAEWVRGRFGTALHFGGHDACVAIPGLAALDGSEALTVEAWVYWEKSGRYPNILSTGSWDPGGFLIFVQDNACAFRMGKPGKAPLTGPDWAETSASFGEFQFGRWYHLVATFARPAIRTYVDGRPVGSAKWDYPVGCAGELQIGSWHNPRTCHTGLIHGVKIYNRALTPAEVLAGYQAGATAHGPVPAGEPVDKKLPVAPPTPAVVLDNRLLRLSLDARGRVVGLVDKATGQDHCAQPSVDFATIRTGGASYRPSSCTYRDGQLTLQFGRSGVTAQVKVTNRDRYFVFELLSVSDAAVAEVVLGSVAVRGAKQSSAAVAWASDGEFATAVVPLNLQVEVGLHGGQQPVFSPRCERRYGLVGAKTALVGCPHRQVRPVLQEVVRASGLPYSPLGGPFALDAPENRGSYLFAVVSEANVDEWIALGRRGGFAEIHLCPWWRTMGHYEPNPSLYPHGLAGLKQVVAKLHAAGLKVGMHTLTGCIQVDDPWVSPVPDPRLAKDARFTLAAAVGPDDKVISTVERPEGLETFWSDMSTGNTIQIGDEIIAYSGISSQPPYGFTGCTRGHWRTRRAAHAQGAAAAHLVASYQCYMPDENTTLVDELAACIAEVYNTCGFDMIYLDGSEGMRTSHAVALMKRAIFGRLKGRVLVESSSGSWGAWPFHSRVGAWDHPVWGFNRFNDLHCASLATHATGEMLPGHMGWWVVTGPSVDHAGMFPEDMEYFAGKCLGWDHSSSLQGVGAGAAPPNARQDEYLTMLGRYERLRLARYFAPNVLEQLRQPGAQFRLGQADDGAWQLRPTDYAPHKVTALDDGTPAWTVRNRFAAQPVKVRIEALYACQPYDSPEAVLVADFARPEQFATRATAPGVKQDLTTAAEPARPGTVSGCLTATNSTGARRGAWTKLGQAFGPPLKMSHCGALGVWVYGDGKGELLNFQLNNNREDYTAWDDHYVDVNFTGWRYFELLLRERDAQRHQDYLWPYGGACEVGRSPLVRGRVGAFNLYTNDLPVGEPVRCFVSPVKALPVLKVKLSNPTVTVGGQTLSFPVTLESGQFVEYEGGAAGVVRDERGEVVARVTPQGAGATLATGDNAVRFTCEGSAPVRTRAQVTLISQGTPLSGRNPAGQVDARLLSTEYDDPRTIGALDGQQNEWDVVAAGTAALCVDLTVDRATAPPGNDRPGQRMVLETGEDAAGFADTPDNQYRRYVFDGEHNQVAAKPGVTVSLDRVGDPVKVGQGSLRLRATSTRNDAAGWCARGRRFAPALNLASYARLGLWVHGDAGGESLKLQLRDVAGAWQDLVTPIDFSGWRRLEFALGDGATLNLAQVEYLIVYYNNLPAGRTVTCYLDQIEVRRDVGGIQRPVFRINGQPLLFPTTLSAGERLAYDGQGPALVYGRDGRVRERCQPTGQAPALRPGRNRVRFAFDEHAVGDYRVRLQAVKAYRAVAP